MIQALSTWTPTEVQVLVFPETPDTWSCSFSWGQPLAEQLFQWIQMLQWPSSPHGPLEREIGVTWLELAVSFSMYIGKMLPVLRTNAQNQSRLLFLEDQADVDAYAASFADLATTFQKMWTQLTIWLPASAFPRCTRGLQPSLYVQGFLQSASGFSLRPAFPYQDAVAKYLHPRIQGKSSYAIAYDATWLTARTTPLQDKCWKTISDRLKYRHRTGRGERP